MFYVVDFACDDNEELQSKLNIIYNYKNDITTKIMHRNRMNLFFLLLSKLKEKNSIKSYDSAIDIGCNSGAYSKIISELGFKYVLGIDIDEGLIENANRHFRSDDNDKKIEFKIMDAKNLDSEQKFNFILCTEVLEHTDDPSRIINNIEKILSSDGIAIITLPNKISLPYLIDFLLKKVRNISIDQDFKRHLDYPFYKSIKLLKDNHFVILSVDGTNLFFSGSILRFLYGRSIFPFLNKINFDISRY